MTRRLHIATEAVTDPYGGIWTHTRSIQKYSHHSIEEFPSRFKRLFLDRSPRLRHHFRKTAAIKGFDIVHSRSDPWYIDLCCRCRTNRQKWVQSFHAMFHAEDYPEGLAEWQLEQNKAVLEIGRQADLRISVSQWGQDMLLKEYGIETHVIVNGADLETCANADARRFTGKYNLKDFVLFIGSFREVKNPALFVRLAARMPDLTFVMIGDKVEETFLKEKYGIAPTVNVHFLGRQSREDSLDALAASKVYVMTSKHEGLPNSLLEAMGMGKKAVVPAHTGCLELVPTEEYGYLYDLHSLEDLTRAVEKACRDDNIRGQNARRRIEENYNWKLSTAKLDRLYESLFT